MHPYFLSFINTEAVTRGPPCLVWKISYKFDSKIDWFIHFLHFVDNQHAIVGVELLH